jgi:TolB protein
VDVSALIQKLGLDDKAVTDLIEHGKKLMTLYRSVTDNPSSNDKVSPADCKRMVEDFAKLLREQGCASPDPKIKSRASRIMRDLYNYASPKILFQCGEKNIYQIYIMNADGSDKRPVVSSSASDGSPVISSKNKVVFFSNRTGNTEIYTVDLDGSNLKRLTKNQVDDFQPNWRPDGKKIAFVSDRDDKSEIWVMDTDGRNLKQLTENVVLEGDPAWSPDGKKIAFSSMRDDQQELYVMNADGANQTRLTISPGTFDYAPCWSPDGKRIAYTLHAIKGGANAIYIMDADGKPADSGKKPAMLAAGIKNAAGPAWSPDGKRIAFASRAGSVCAEIYAVDIDGQNLKRLTNDEQRDDHSPCWVPSPYEELAHLFANP